MVRIILSNNLIKNIRGLIPLLNFGNRENAEHCKQIKYCVDFPWSTCKSKQQGTAPDLLTHMPIHPSIHASIYIPLPPFIEMGWPQICSSPPVSAS